MRVVHHYKRSYGLFQHLKGPHPWEEAGGDTTLPASPGRHGKRATHARQGKPAHEVEEQESKKSSCHKHKWQRVVQPIPKREPIDEKISRNSYHCNSKYGENRVIPPLEDPLRHHRYRLSLYRHCCSH